MLWEPWHFPFADRRRCRLVASAAESRSTGNFAWPERNVRVGQPVDFSMSPRRRGGMSKVAHFLVVLVTGGRIWCYLLCLLLVLADVLLYHLIGKSNDRGSPSDIFNARKLDAVSYAKSILAISRFHSIFTYVDDDVPESIVNDGASADARPSMPSYAFHGVDRWDQVPCLLDRNFSTSDEDLRVVQTQIGAQF